MEYLFALSFLRACSRNLILLICSLKIFGVCISYAYVRYMSVMFMSGVCVSYIYVRCLSILFVRYVYVRCMCQLCLSGVCVIYVYVRCLCQLCLRQMSVSVMFKSCVCRNRLQIDCRNRRMNKETRWVNLQITPRLSKELLILKRLGLLTNLIQDFPRIFFDLWWRKH